jgi:hypothetical protein
MSINLSPNIPANVVEIGNEVTQNVVDSLANASSPSAANPLLTASAGNAAYAGLTANNTLTGTQAYNVNSAGAAFRISQAGAGEAFRVEDTTTPDTSPFVVTADGRVGIQTTTVGSNSLAVVGNTSITSGGLTVSSTVASTFTMTSGTGVPLTIQNNGTGNSFVVNDEPSDTSQFVIDANGDVGIGGGVVAGSKLNVQGNLRVIGTSTLAGAATITVSSGSTVPLTVQNSGTGNSFVVNDDAGDTSPFVIDNAGNVGIKRSSPAYDLDVNGTVHVGTLRFGDGTSMTTAPSAGGPLVLTDGLYTTTYGEGFIEMENDGDIYFSVSGPYITLTNGTSVMEIGGTKIIFPDATEQTTAYVPPTYETTGLATNVNRTDFPNEIAIVIAGVTYRIPARQV